MLAEVLPAAAETAETFEDPADARLFPEEEALIAKAVDKRRREFTTARHCARQALARLGLPPAPLVHGERGAPTWPAGVVGSMTHCDGYRAAAVARRADIASLGIDAEPHGPLPEGVYESVTLPAERRHLGGLAALRPDVHWDRLLFSAKESVYKTWFPLTGAWLDFEEAHLEFEAASGGAARGTFAARLLVSRDDPEGRALTGFQGRWLVRDGLVVTAIAYPPAA
ncbi:4'-phosphopantetheinyl transferase superfamily protein [Streptomyces varsoviensis]|uniref:4'-phosphopantetheinyl transferase family protein n=1 Tax=Streptomyces varsoviensis TaxID=67373 RepID=UPI0033F3CE79